jgi:hypothetical protein
MWRRATILAALAAFTLWGSATAWAHHKPDHAGGPPASSQVTEDNDSDGVPNAPDPQGDSDNRHPSGNDKHEEGGQSGNQGSSSSEPDGDGHGPERDEGGLDKPDGPGGLDVLDQDGNNGCGNDDDFEDDNEGWCGKPDQQAASGSSEEDVDSATDTEDTSAAPTETVATHVSAGTAASGTFGAVTSVLGVTASADESVAGGPEVLGVVVRAVGAAPAVAGIPLAFTGANALPLVALAVGLSITGAILLLVGRRAARA